jgi:6-phospho-3-hexuloisomerase
MTPAEPDIPAIAAAILAEQSLAIGSVSRHEIANLMAAISSANRIFVQGEGRSGLVMRTFAMRLMHLGYPVHAVGETTTPSIGSGDLLIACSGSGETDVTVLMSSKAAMAGATVAAITAAAESRLAKVAVASVIVPAPHKRTDTNESIQYGGSLFEQVTFILCEAIVLGLMTRDTRAAGFESLAKRHANLE